jgi:hypothetical protein
MKDEDIEAWASELPPNPPLRILNHRYSSVTPKAVADFVFPKCPNLWEVIVDSQWTDEAIVSWTNSGVFLRTAIINSINPLDPELLADFVKACGKFWTKFSMLFYTNEGYGVFCDRMIENLCECPDLLIIDIGMNDGVSESAWQNLRKLKKLVTVNIGSHTCPPDLQKSISLYQPAHYHQTFQQKREADEKAKVKRERERQRIKEEKEMFERRTTEIGEYILKFLESKKAEIFAVHPEGDIKKIAEAAQMIGRASPDFPTDPKFSQAAERMLKSMSFQIGAEGRRLFLRQEKETEKEDQNEEEQGFSLF